MLDELETNPKQFPKKGGKLQRSRAVDMVFRDGIVWRAVFSLDEATRTVLLHALDPHDEAYAKAERRA